MGLVRGHLGLRQRAVVRSDDRGGIDLRESADQLRSDFARCVGCVSCNVRRRDTFGRSGTMASFAATVTLPAFDQQPLEAWATVSASLTAAELSDDDSWNLQADLALAWFLGCNDLRVPIANVETGACHDGLQFDRVNRNQGAESTLAWLISAVDWQRRRGRTIGGNRSIDRTGHRNPNARFDHNSIRHFAPMPEHHLRVNSFSKSSSLTVAKVDA